MKRVKIIKIILLSIFSCICFSCEYDYIMPDYSNAKPCYIVPSEPNSELRGKLITIAKDYGLTLKYSSEYWEVVVKEKDALNNVLYEGEPRYKADSKAKKLQVSYICSCLLQSAGREKFDICQFDFSRDFPLEISPYACDAIVTIDDKFDVHRAKNAPYIYNIDRNLPTIEKVNSLGYRIADVKTIITEIDNKGEFIRTFEHRSIDGMIFTVGAETIDVEIALYGFASTTSSSEYVGSYYFKDIKLKDITGTTFILTEDIEHEFRTKV